MPPGRLTSVNRTSMAAPESIYSSASSAVVTSWTKKPDALRTSATRLLMSTSSSTTRTEIGAAPRPILPSHFRRQPPRQCKRLTALQKVAAFMVSKGLTKALGAGSSPHAAGAAVGSRIRRRDSNHGKPRKHLHRDHAGRAAEGLCLRDLPDGRKRG